MIVDRIATFLAIIVCIHLSGCSNDHRLPFSGNQITGYLFKEKKCNSNNCSLENSGDFILNVNEQSQRVIYKLSINWGSGFKKIYVGELKNCRVFSVSEFDCQGLENIKGNLKFRVKYEESALVASKPEDFNEVDAMSDSLLTYISAFSGVLNAGNKENFENYDVLAYFIAIAAMVVYAS
jgi:hypothetical protein